MLETAPSDMVTDIFPDGKWPGRGVDHPPPYISGVVYGQSYASPFSMCLLACDETTFTFTLMMVENVSGIETTQRKFLWRNHTENIFFGRM